MSDLAKRSGDMAALLEKMRPAIAQALPKHISPERIARIALTALRSNPKLAECTPQSFLGSLLQASQLGLEVNTPLGYAYLIPYKTTCTLVIGYQGMLDLARRSGMVKAIYAHPVHDGDVFSFELGLEPKLKHVPCERPGPLTHVYSVARLTDGEPIFTVLNRADVERYRARSRAANDGPWVTDYEAMALKTSVRRIFKWLPKSAEMAQALGVDEADDNSRQQSEAFSPEVIGILGALPDEPAPSPVPEGTPQGQRISMKGSKTKGAAAPVTDASSAPPPPALKAPAAAPADLGPVDPCELHEALADVDNAWAGEGCSTVIAAWTPEQQRTALAWAHWKQLGDPKAAPVERPKHTIMGRQPGED